MVSRRERLETMLAKEPDDAFLNFGLAMELVKEHRWDEAVTHFDRAVAIDPNYVAAHYHKGNALMIAGRMAEARHVLLDGIRIAEAAGEGHAASEMQALLERLS